MEIELTEEERKTLLDMCYRKYLCLGGGNFSFSRTICSNDKAEMKSIINKLSEKHED